MAGGGALLIPDNNLKEDERRLLIKNYADLPHEKMTLKKIIHILIYNFSYNYFFFLIFNRLFEKRRHQTFTIEEKPVRYFSMNGYLRKLFYSQFRRKSDKERSEKHTLHYFNSQPNLAGKYCYGSMSFYPVRLALAIESLVDSSVEKFMLWDNLIESYQAFEVSISRENFPKTFDFFEKYIFLPAKFYAVPDKRGNTFPGELS